MDFKNCVCLEPVQEYGCKNKNSSCFVSSAFNQSLSSLQSKMKTANEQLQLLLIPKSCEESIVNGTQRLKSGEEVYCHNGWQVS